MGLRGGLLKLEKDLLPSRGLTHASRKHSEAGSFSIPWTSLADEGGRARVSPPFCAPLIGWNSLLVALLAFFHRNLNTALGISGAKLSTYLLQ